MAASLTRAQHKAQEAQQAGALRSFRIVMQRWQGMAMSRCISCWTARSLRGARAATVDVPDEIQRKLEKLSAQYKELERARNKAIDRAEEAVTNLDSDTLATSLEAPSPRTAAINTASQSSEGGGEQHARDASPGELRGSGWRKRLAAGSRQAALSPAGPHGCQSIAPFQTRVIR